MKYKIAISVLALSVLVVLVGGHAIRTRTPDSSAPRALPLVQASVTVPGPEDPVVVPGAFSANTRGWSHASQAAARAGEDGIRPELLDAYTLAAALAPADCHLSVSLLAAIGQVESGNLANRSIDASHRAVPAVLGPVLNGDDVQAIADTDNGRWDGNQSWDRALGPLQLIPASWRVVGLDMDGDGQRDPQNVYDAAGAAMTYLCSNGRDLATPKGLNEAVLAYNNSEKYLKLVLGWKTAFDAADITGLESESAPAAWAAPSIAPQPLPADPTAASAKTQPTRARTVPATGSSTPAGTPTQSGTGPATSSPSSPTKPSVPANPPGSAPSPTPSPKPKPSPTPDPKPTDPTPDPTPDPTLPDCPVPTTDPEADPSSAPSAEASPDEVVVSPETCTPPEGYEFDPETGELVPVPAVTPSP